MDLLRGRRLKGAHYGITGVVQNNIDGAKVFDDLFRASGAKLSDHVTLDKEPLLARHFWPNGSCLDLWDNPVRNASAIEAFAGARARRDFEAFDREARRLFTQGGARVDEDSEMVFIGREMVEAAVASAHDGGP